jgi:glucose-1-phosphate thymidylyltransferase
MKGIILAGGTGTRLYPLTKVSNKHLLPIGKFPMIYYPLMKLKECGIREILIITGKEHLENMVDFLGSGADYEVEFTYIIQDSPGGIAHALRLGKNFVGDDRSVVILGDNIFSAKINDFVAKYQMQAKGAKVLVKQVSDPHRYGVAELVKDRIVSIEEKPKVPKSNFCVTGIYMYDSTVFEIIDHLKPSARGELEITEVNNAYIQEGTLTYDVIDSWWIDAGTFESIYQANEHIHEFGFGDLGKVND